MRLANWTLQAARHRVQDGMEHYRAVMGGLDSIMNSPVRAKCNCRTGTQSAVVWGTSNRRSFIISVS